MILYAPRAIVKFGSVAADARERLISCIYALYQGRLSLSERLQTKEWAMIGSLGDGITSGEIPRYYRAMTRPDAEGAEVAYHYRIHEAGLWTQNYHKGFEKFVRKLERNEAMTATVSVQSGYRDDHGWAVYCTQVPGRCLLLDTVDGLTDEEALWTALAACDSFKPRKASPMKFPGTLFYPMEASHVFERYGDYFPNLDSRPDFASESRVCEDRMIQFSMALAKLRHKRRTPTVGGSSDEDEPTGSEWIWSQTKGCMRRNKFFRQKVA
jgi:hypothetical protein